MNNQEARQFLKGEMEFSPQRMMRYIRFRARLASNEDVEDILQAALLLVVKHFDPGYPDAKLPLYCLGACNKAIAQNLERYHKVVLRKKTLTKSKNVKQTYIRQEEHHKEEQKIRVLNPGKTFNEEEACRWRTVSLDSLFDEDDGRSAEEFLGWEVHARDESDPVAEIFIKELISQVLQVLPPGVHRLCFILKYVNGYKREDLIRCLKMDAKSIDTVDKKIVRTLKAFKERLEEGS